MDLRERPLAERRGRLSALLEPLNLLAPSPIRVSPEVRGDTWEALAGARAQARDRGVEGIMLKRPDSPFRTGRRRGDWWKWKIDPYIVDAMRCPKCWSPRPNLCPCS